MEKRQYQDPYYGSLFDEYTKNKIEKVTEYIKNSRKKVIIITPDAALYMIPLKQSNSEFDLLLLGNIGLNGENKVIEKLSRFEDEIVLVKKQELSYQEPRRIREYVENNFENIGEICDLNIYKK